MASVRRPRRRCTCRPATAATAAPRSTGRSSSRSAAPTAATAGDGGDVILEVDPNVHTLLDFHHRPHQKAGNGKPGEGSNRNGADGERRRAARARRHRGKTADGEVLADLVGAGTRFVARRAAAGAASATPRSPPPRRKAPGFALLGEPGEALRRRPRAQDRRRRRPGRLPARRQVLADRGDVRGPAEDRRLPVHHADPEPRRGPGRRQSSPSPTCPA